MTKIMIRVKFVIVTIHKGTLSKSNQVKLSNPLVSFIYKIQDLKIRKDAA